MAKNRLLVFLALCGLLALSAQAAPITMEQAQQEAAAFLQQKRQAGRALKVAARASKAMTAAGVSNSDAAYYVFNIGDNQGFVIVSGDDRTNPILGYSDQGHFDEAKAPANLKAWLAEYALQITQLNGLAPAQLDRALAARRVERAVDTRNSIAPMVTTKWNQADPYWAKCPEFMSLDEQGDTVGEMTYVGCVAVSMSQVMKYHNWPEKTTKLIPSYTYSIPNGDYTWSSIEMEELPVTTFDWAHMKDSYNGSEDATQIDAVSTLMYYAGAAVKSQYNLSSTGAYTDDIPKGLTEYFAYDKNTIQIKFRTDFTQEAWDNMVYQELAAGRPLIYNGTAGTSGHSFVCDGYECGNYFHINWGWGGMGNGYFQLAVLNPRESGIGGSSSSEGYNMKQNIIIGIQPGDPEGGDTPGPQVEDALTVTSIGLYSNPYDQKTTLDRDGKNYGFSVYKNQFFKVSYADHVGTQKKYDVGVALYDTDGNFVELIINRGTYSTALTSALGSTEQLGRSINDSRSAPKFAKGLTGSYKVVPVYMLQGTDEWKPMLESDRYYLDCEITNYAATFASHPVLNLKVQGMEFEGGEKVGSPERIHVTLANNSADRFFGDLYLAFGSQQMDEYSQYTTSVQAEVLSGQEATVTFNVTPANAGTQTLRLFYDANCEQQVAGTGTVTIAPLVTSTMDLSVKIAAENAVDGVIYDSHARFRVDITNEGEGEYNKYVLAPLFIVDIDPETGKVGGSMITYSQSALQLQPGETKTLYFNFNDLAYGSIYSLNIYARNENDELVNIVTPGGSILYEIQRGLVTWDGTSMTGTGIPASGDIVVPANALAARLEGLEMTTVTPSGNPNTIYFLGEDEAVPAALEGLNVVKGSVAERISLTDGYGYFTPQSITARTISYERSFAQTREQGVAQGWSTIVLPFAPTAVMAGENEIDWCRNEEETGKALWLGYFNQEQDGVVTFDHAAKMEANVPYIIALDKAAGLTGTPITWTAADVLLKAEPIAYTSGEKYMLAGTFVDMAVDGAYVVDAQGAVAQWAAEAQPVAAFRAYFKELAALDQHDNILLPGEPRTALEGDVDGNGVVNGSDVTALYNYLLNGAVPAGQPDVDGNGTVNGSDVTALYNLLLK